MTESGTISLERGPAQWRHIVGGGAVVLESAMDAIEALSLSLSSPLSRRGRKSLHLTVEIDPPLAR
jgi:hypothetical protein